MIDLNGSVQLTNCVGAFMQVRNLYHVPEYRYQVEAAYVLSHVRVGTFLTVGIKGAY